MTGRHYVFHHAIDEKQMGNDRMSKIWFQVALINFLVAATMGVLMRLAFAIEIPWLDFRFWVHAHSHVAMLGWLYIALAILLYKTFLSETAQAKTFYRTNLLLTQIAVIGMAVSFPLQGYGPVAIFFTSAHAILSYFFFYRFLKDLDAPGIAGVFLRIAIFFLFFSTLSLWAMPIIILAGLQGKALYYQAVQFYLHFQFNGWFIFSIIALFLHQIHSRGIIITNLLATWFLRLLVISTFLTYAMAVTWSNPSALLFSINGMGVIIQLSALFVFLALLKQHIPTLKQRIFGWERWLLSISFVCLVLKIVVQSAVVLPFIATISYTIRNYVIGFIHLILLGAITFYIFSETVRRGMLSAAKPSVHWGLILIIVGFTGSEFLLFFQGTLLWAELGFLSWYYIGLVLISAFIPAGLLLLLVSTWQKKLKPI
ncbi:MAG: hypothetical protein KA479_02585 [Saprospiraceae bacterium]|nr:hypothetical protein [Saprospiraceae bacterium]